MKWEDYKEIAEVLNTLYPSTGPVMMSRTELIEKVIGLPGFSGDKNTPDNFYLSAIAKKWILIRDNGRTSTIDDSPFI